MKNSMVKPRWRRLICRLIDHDWQPAERQVWDDTLGRLTVPDPGRTVCSTCGVCPEDIMVTRREVVLAGVGSLIGPELYDGSVEWGDRRIHRPGRFGVRQDFTDPPDEHRASR